MHDPSAKTASAQQIALEAHFQDICRRIVEQMGDEDLARPLSYWALNGDRRLPYALLGFPLRQLVKTPYAELASTPGIGPKKMHALLLLMQRALEGPQPRSFVIETTVTREQPVPVRDGVFDPSMVSELLWDEWRDTVRRQQLGGETLGRLAPCLRDLPTVIWKARLQDYLPLSLGALRALKTHGEKRVCLVLEIFFTIHELLGGAGQHPRYSVLLQPSFIGPIEQWIRWAVVEGGEAPSVQELRQSLLLPLLNQIERDAGEPVHRLACGRLGIEAEPESVRDQARRMGVTRTRIYQLLETCSQIMDVRWPEGRWRLAELAKRFEGLDDSDERHRLFDAARSLLFPTRVEQPQPDLVST